MAGRFTGQSIERVEDQRLLRGQGRFAAGISRVGMRHIAFVRSTQAHARLVAIDTSAARALPGVVAVLTAEDLAKVMTGPIVVMVPPNVKVAPFHPLATAKVRLVGDPIAMVVAESEAIAHDAAVLSYTLKVENVALEAPSSIRFDFLGKDSIRYENTVAVDGRVYALVGKFVARDGAGNAQG